MKNLTITNRYATILEAVRANNVDLSYNEKHALDTINWLQTDRRFTIDLVFTADDGNIYYVSTVKAENLKLLHKFTPFVSVVHNNPFTVLVPVDTQDNFTPLPEAAALKSLGNVGRTAEARQAVAKVGLIAYAA